MKRSARAICRVKATLRRAFHFVFSFGVDENFASASLPALEVLAHSRTLAAVLQAASMPYVVVHVVT